MKASQSLTAALVAAAMVGGIGFAYAQTGDSPTPNPGNPAATQPDATATPNGSTTAPNTTPSTPAAPDAGTTTTTPSTGSSTTPSTDASSSGSSGSTMAPQADRN